MGGKYFQALHCSKFFLPFLIDRMAEYKILVWKLIPLRIVKALLSCLLVSRVAFVKHIIVWMTAILRTCLSGNFSDSLLNFVF